MRAMETMTSLAEIAEAVNEQKEPWIFPFFDKNMERYDLSIKEQKKTILEM